MRSPAVEPPAAEGAEDEGEELPGEAAGSSGGDASPARAPRARGRGVEAGTQAEAGTSEWTSYDLRRAMRLLHSTDDGGCTADSATTPRSLLARGHTKLLEILRPAGAPLSAQRLVKEIVDTCRVCRMWSKPAPKSMTTVRMAKDLSLIHI